MSQLTLQDYPFKMEIAVQWGDMDAANHVNNTIYLRWAESSRIAYFTAMGGIEFRDTIGAIVAWQDCKYVFPVTFPDTVIVGVRVLEIQNNDRLVMQTGMFSLKHQRLVAISHQHIMAYDYVNLRKAALPTEWIAAVRGLEGGTGLKIEE